MATIDALSKRIDTMIEQVEQRRGPAEEDFYSDIRSEAYLLTEQERTDMLELLAAIEQKTGSMTRWLDGIHTFRLLTDSERDKLYLWVHLLEVLKQGDEKEAARYRRYLDQDLDTLIAQFMSIPEQEVPEAGSDQVEMIQRGHTIYPMSRIMLRCEQSSIKREIECNRRFIGDIDTMRLWCDWFFAAELSE